jgi:hypothetical protein
MAWRSWPASTNARASGADQLLFKAIALDEVSVWPGAEEVRTNFLTNVLKYPAPDQTEDVEISATVTEAEVWVREAVRYNRCLCASDCTIEQNRPG